MHGFMHGLGNQIITHTHCLRTFNSARDRVSLLTVTALDATQDDRKEWLNGSERLKAWLFLDIKSHL